MRGDSLKKTKKINIDQEMNSGSTVDVSPSKAKRKNRDLRSAKEELLDFFDKHGKVSVSLLSSRNSGLEKYLRLNHGGVREFCKKEQLEYILAAPKKVNWTDELAIKTLNELYEKIQIPLTRGVLTQYGLNGLYQWISKQHGGYRGFCERFGIKELIETQEDGICKGNSKEPKVFWNDALCFRVIKQLFIETGQVVTPESLKRKYKGAHGYIYTKYGDLTMFAETFDLQEFVSVNHVFYDDEMVIGKIKEAYRLKGERVNAAWLRANGYSTVCKYLGRLGKGNFIEGAKVLGVEEYVTQKYVYWDSDQALKTTDELYSEIGHPISNKDFEENRLTGLRDWICVNYGDLLTFFEMHGMRDKYIVLGEDFKTRWAFGIRFEKIVKEAIECLFGDVIYNKFIPNTRLRPDFVFLNNGLWIDAKLSTDAYYFDDTVKKYLSCPVCEELWLVCLIGSKRIPKEDDVKVIKIDEWYPKLQLKHRSDIIEKVEEIKRDVALLNQEAFKIQINQNKKGN